jgi:hypothetical protein
MWVTLIFMNVLGTALSQDQCSVPSAAIPMNWTLMSGTGNTFFADNALVKLDSLAKSQDPVNSSLAYVFGRHQDPSAVWRAALYEVDLPGNSVTYLAGGQLITLRVTRRHLKQETMPMCGWIRIECCGYMEEIHPAMSNVIYGNTV